MATATAHVSVSPAGATTATAHVSVTVSGGGTTRKFYTNRTGTLVPLPLYVRESTALTQLSN